MAMLMKKIETLENKLQAAEIAPAEDAGLSKEDERLVKIAAAAAAGMVPTKSSTTEDTEFYLSTFSYKVRWEPKKETW